MDKLTQEDAKRIAERYYYKLGTHDINVMNDIYTPDLILEDDGEVDVIKGHEGAKKFLSKMFATFPDVKFELIQEPLLGPEGDTMALLVRGTSTRKSKRKATGNTVKWEFGSFYKVDLKTERMKYGESLLTILILQNKSLLSLKEMVNFSKH
ncbi:nuclear transport factor 2 family protein [Metabacillus halosaccharovorans]|uniref:nuclear transport factor 2 family protein n=1 Tax=Metabacillus halosaccharovorans TaxID=930124 RepID=UPI003734F8E8